MGIGNIGWAEFLLILAIALVFFGPRRLPGIAQTIGKSLREFQKALNEVKSELAQAGREADTRPDLKRIVPRPAELLHTDTTPLTAPDSEEPEVTREASAAVEPGSKDDNATSPAEMESSPESAPTTKPESADVEHGAAERPDIQ